MASKDSTVVVSTNVASDKAVTVEVKPVAAQKPIKKEQDFKTFMIDFLMGGVSAAVSKTIASPI
jgi:hypothetical protein